MTPITKSADSAAHSPVGPRVRQTGRGMPGCNDGSREPYLAVCPFLKEVTVGPNTERQAMEKHRWQATIAFEDWVEGREVSADC